MLRHNSVMGLKFSFILFFFVNIFFCIRPSFPAVVAPIVQDPSTRQYTLSLYLKTPLQPTNLLLDLGASLSWVECTTNGSTSSVYHPIPCNSPLCSSLTSLAACSHCSKLSGPACAVNDSCHIFLSSRPHQKGVMVQALVDKLALPITDGRNPGPLRVIPEFVLSCSNRSLMKGLVPRGMTGLAALGRSNFSLAMQVSTGSPKVFALCLSGSPSAPGVAFFSTAGPYIFLPKETDLSKYLNYTPLLSNHDNRNGPSSEYFIGLTSIKVNGRIAVQINQTQMGLPGAKLSLEAPYTILESSMYAALTKAFVNESAAYKLSVTQPVTPFSVCFDAADVADTGTGPAVPTIDLIMEGADQKLWRIFGSNSMVRILRSREGVDVWCLAFVDGGINPRWPIVIGGHQMVDNLLQFDLESERLGYSSSVLVHSTMCANFNWTVNTRLT